MINLFLNFTYQKKGVYSKKKKNKQIKNKKQRIASIIIRKKENQNENCHLLHVQ